MVTGAVRLLRLYRRVAASTWVGLYAALLLTSGMHQLVVDHAVCEHGAVVHEGHGAAHDDLAELAAATIFNADAHDDHHAHCSIDVRSEELVVAHAAPQMPAPVIDAVLVAIASAERDARRSLRALRLAPKHSPPRLS